MYILEKFVKVDTIQFPSFIEKYCINKHSVLFASIKNNDGKLTIVMQIRCLRGLYSESECLILVKIM